MKQIYRNLILFSSFSVEQILTFLCKEVSV